MSNIYFLTRKDVYTHKRYPININEDEKTNLIADEINDVTCFRSFDAQPPTLTSYSISLFYESNYGKV